MNKKGLFITFEGADGSGKSTQLNKIIEYFKRNNINFISTRDPGGTDLGKKLREILLHYDGKVYSNCELFLYLADRAQHVEEKLIPALEEGKIVLCDRYIDSSVAYQGHARGIGVEKVDSLNEIVAQGLKPDLTLFFDVDVDIALDRIGDNKDRLESEARDFHEKVREGYLNLAKRNPDRIKVINTDRDIEVIHNEAISIIKECMEQKNV